MHRCAFILCLLAGACGESENPLYYDDRAENDAGSKPEAALTVDASMGVGLDLKRSSSNATDLDVFERADLDPALGDMQADGGDLSDGPLEDRLDARGSRPEDTSDGPDPDAGREPGDTGPMATMTKEEYIALAWKGEIDWWTPACHISGALRRPKCGDAICQYNIQADESGRVLCCAGCTVNGECLPSTEITEPLGCKGGHSWRLPSNWTICSDRGFREACKS